MAFGEVVGRGLGGGGGVGVGGFWARGRRDIG